MPCIRRGKRKLLLHQHCVRATFRAYYQQLIRTAKCGFLQLPRCSADLALLSLPSAPHCGLNVGSEADREERAQGGQSCSSAAASAFTPWRIASSSVLA